MDDIGTVFVLERACHRVSAYAADLSGSLGVVLGGTVGPLSPPLIWATGSGCGEDGHIF